jgi:Tfp pilus assembly protein PilF
MKKLAQVFDQFHVFFAVTIIAATVTFAYSNTFQVPFVFDDTHNIIDNPKIKFSSITSAGLLEAARESPSKWRLVSNISFALNYFYGQRDLYGYHLVNLLIHIATALLFYFLALKTVRLPIFSGKDDHAAEIALFASLLWALHPVQTNAVTYIVQRMTSLAAFFSVGALLFYVQGRLRRDFPLVRYLFYGGAILCFGLALLSKENAAMLPVIVAGYEVFFLRDSFSLEKEWRKFFGVAISALFCVGIIGWLYLGNANIFQSLMGGYGSRDFTMVERLLTESRVLVYYLSLLLLPLPSRLNLDYDFLLSKTIVSPPQTFLALGWVAGLVVLIVILYRRGHRLAGFSLFWFLASLVIESSFVPLELVFEHRLYLPAMFPALGCSWLVFGLARSRVNISRVALVAAVSLCLLFTWQRNALWATPYDFWMDAVAKSPGKARVHSSFAFALKKKGDYAAAQQHYQKAIEIDPEYGVAYWNLGLLYKDRGLFKQAIAVLQEGILRDPLSDTYYALGLVYGQIGDYRGAIRQAELALHGDPAHLRALVIMGISYDELGDLETAYQKFDDARRSGHDTSNLFYNWAITCNKMGRRDEALAKLEEGLRLHPGNQKLVALRQRILQGQ